MNRLSRDKRLRIIAALVEGCSINSIVRMTSISKPTILKLLLDVGRACLNYEDEAIRDLPSKRIEADEVWGFCHSKDKNVRPENVGKPGHGSVWTWIAIDPDTKLLVSWLMGDRDAGHAHAFMHDLASRLRDRPQLTTDALGVYAEAVLDAFDRLGVDYAQVQKIFGQSRADERRYSPPQCIGCRKQAVYGRPRRPHVSTSHVERSNLTLRMSQRRWTRLTNAHSKSFTHMEAAFALHACWYNWCRRHMTLGTTPAVAARLTDHEWPIEDLVILLEEQERADRERAGDITATH
jgi:IS1 family transposase